MTDTSRVTAIREHPRRPGRYELTLDPSGEKLPVSVDLIAELKIRVGRVLTQAELATLIAGSRAVACYDKALATLGARARSAGDLRRWLKTKEFTEAEIAPAIEKLSALGLLDDRQFALGFARSRMAPGRGFGPRRIAAELAKRGVARAVVDSVLNELGAEQDQAAEDAEARGETTASNAQLAAQKKLRSMAKLAPDVQKRRLFGYLARRGFAQSEISAVLNSLRKPRET
jgi:regulatory protein